MATPKNATILRGAPLKSGVMLGVSPSSDPNFDVELARATSSGVYQTIARMTPKGEGVPVVYTDLLPNDGFARTYKARAVRDGWLAGDYTAAVSATPVELPEIAPNITPLTGKGIGSPLYAGSTGGALGRIKYGTANAVAYRDRVLRIDASQMRSSVASTRFAYGGRSAGIGMTLANSTGDLFFPLAGYSGIGANDIAYLSSIAVTYKRRSTASVVQYGILGNSYTTVAPIGNYLALTACTGVSTAAGGYLSAVTSFTSSAASVGVSADVLQIQLRASTGPGAIAVTDRAVFCGAFITYKVLEL